jgi:hypothetical protein
VGRSLLKVAGHVLKNGTPYREPDPGVMHELEKQKLVHHHARRLRALGAEPEAVEAIVQQLLCPDATPEQPEAPVAVKEVGVVEERRWQAVSKDRSSAQGTRRAILWKAGIPGAASTYTVLCHQPAVRETHDAYRP